ncbi:TonB-dependent receptor family protein [Arenimonas sp.]|uniref:TonB-dependent receptor family protein n=1 Tax=Arenimonas sp. TaxID=1872635 RepID=UPI002E3252DF|nr:TonB-dependent receptor [Arenimonas sp.]HEX4853339.1 TonB-dependent receptor [Arenimonas sp.]
MSPSLRLAISLALLPTAALASGAPSPELQRLDSVNVFGTAEDTQKAAGSAHYVDQETLERFNYRDINRVLRQVPGVYLVEEEGYGLRPNIGIRGSGTDRNSRITVMEDGVLIAPAPYAAPAAYYFPTMARIDAVEIRKGSSAIQAGPRTTGGAINLISTPIPSEGGGELDLSYGSDATVLAHGWAGGMGERFGGMVEVVRQSTNGFKQIDGGGDAGYELNDVVAKLRWVSAPDAGVYQQLDLKVGHNTQDSNETYLGLADADFRADPNRRYAASRLDNIQTEQNLLELRHLIELGDNTTLNTVAYRTEFSRNWYKLNDVLNPLNGSYVGIGTILADPATWADQYAWLTGEDSPANALRLRNNNRSYYAQGLQTVLGTRFATGAASHELEVGLRVHRDQEDRYQDDDRYRLQGGQFVLTRDGAPGTQDNRVGDAEALSLFVHDTISFGKWILTPGVRYERIDLASTRYSTATGLRDVVLSKVETEVDEVIPGFGATYLLSDSLTLFGSVHRGFNPPGPASGALSEKSVNGEFGLRWNQGATGVELVGFVNDYSNLVGTCTASSGGNCNLGDQFDGGEARVSGLEASLGYDFNEGGAVSVPFSLAYTYTQAEFRNAFVSSFEEWGTVAVGDQLPYLPEHLVHAELGLAGERWRLGLAANYLDDMRTEAGSGPGERTDSAMVWDLTGGYQLNDKIELYARVENLSDETYVVARRPAGARPGQPRSAFVGMRIGF